MQVECRLEKREKKWVSNAIFSAEKKNKKKRFSNAIFSAEKRKKRFSNAIFSAEKMKKRLSNAILAAEHRSRADQLPWRGHPGWTVPCPLYAGKNDVELDLTFHYVFIIYQIIVE